MKCLKFVSNICSPSLNSTLSKHKKTQLHMSAKSNLPPPKRKGNFLSSWRGCFFWHDFQKVLSHQQCTFALSAVPLLLTILTNPSSIGPDGPAVNRISCSNEQLLDSTTAQGSAESRSPTWTCLPSPLNKHNICCSQRHSFSCRTWLRNSVWSLTLSTFLINS